jgi:DNA-binding response OmpR family regulator
MLDVERDVEVRRSAEAAPAALATEPAGSVGGRPRREARMLSTHAVILVIEDDPGIREVLSELLGNKGYTVETASDGDAGLARLRQGGVDLVLLDLMLPDVDGLDLCRRVRARGGEVYVPIIMLTALAGAAERHEGFSAGADDYVLKPFSAEDLLDRVQVWLQARQRLQNASDRVRREVERRCVILERSRRRTTA